MPSTAIASDTTQKNEEENLNYFQKIWRFRHYLTVEPFVVVTLLATIINSIAVQYFPISKACHVNLGYNKELCDALFSKTEYNIDCDIFNFDNVTDFKADTLDSMKNINKISDEFKYTACKAEVGAQKLLANIIGKCTPIGIKHHPFQSFLYKLKNIDSSSCHIYTDCITFCWWLERSLQ